MYISAAVVMKKALIKHSGFKTKQDNLIKGKKLEWRRRTDLMGWREGTRGYTGRVSRTLSLYVKLSQNIIKNSAYLEATYEGKQVCLRLGKHRCKTYLTENFYQNS